MKKKRAAQIGALEARTKKIVGREKAISAHIRSVGSRNQARRDSKNRTK